MSIKPDIGHGSHWPDTGNLTWESNEVLGTTVPIRDSREYIRVFFKLTCATVFLGLQNLAEHQNPNACSLIY